MTTAYDTGLKRERAKAAIMDDPLAGPAILAERANVSASLIHEVRRELLNAKMIPSRYEPGTGYLKVNFDRMAAAIKADPTKPTKHIAEETGISSSSLHDVRVILVERGEIPHIPARVRNKRGRDDVKARLSRDGLTPAQRIRAAGRFIDANVITLDSIVFAMESIDPNDVDCEGKRESINKMLADAGKIRHFLSRVITQERNTTNAH